MALAEGEAKHRRSIETAEHARLVHATRSELWTQRLGQIFGFVIVMSLIVGGFVFTAQGKDIGGVASLIAGSAFIIGYFVIGRARKHQPEDQAGE